MQMKTAIESLDIKYGDSITRPKRRTLFPIAIFFAMACAILLIDAILPLCDLWFNEVQLTRLGSWPVLPSMILFQGWPLIPPLLYGDITGVPQVLQGWEELPLLLGSFAIVFLVYLLALRRLPGQITRRYLVISTALLGILYMLIPVVTSPDLYSYIAYARIGVIYHMNPLTTLPTAIHNDIIYPYLYWKDQPSAYGPTWAIITGSLQWLTSLFVGATYILPMVIALRVLGLSMHLVSTLLIWSISGHLQRTYGTISDTTRLHATLAFAWNPLLLFEACVNAHVDTTLLPLLLLAIWFLTRNDWYTENLSVTALAAAMLALATCLKIYTVLFIPGLLIYAWTRAPVQERRKYVAIPAAIYAGIILLLYAPFWQGGAIFNVFFVNPATYRSIGSVADFLGHFYNAIVRDLGFPLGTSIGSPAERLLHTLSLVIFVIIYMLLCWRILRVPQRISTLQSLVRWMALVWFVYCAIGSSWFWPWYITAFLGLFALMEAVPGDNEQWFDIALPRIFTGNNFVRLVRLLSFSMLGLYCFFTWVALHTFIPGLPGFQWSSFGGLWTWVLPLAGTALLLRKTRANTASA
jgi:hypothetical protein